MPAFCSDSRSSIGINSELELANLNAAFVLINRYTRLMRNIDTHNDVDDHCIGDRRPSLLLAFFSL